MKYIPLIILLTPLLITSCESEVGEPLDWDHYYKFVDADGNDFFDTHPDYEIPSIFFNRTPDIHGFSDTAISNGQRILGVDGFIWARGEPTLFDYGNGDIDTLELSWTPSDIDQPSIDNKLKTMSYYFNGELVDHWDFERDPDLLFQMKNTNSPPRVDRGFEPFFTTLVKEAPKIQ